MKVNDEILLEFLDGSLPEGQKKKIEELIQHDESIKARYNILVSIDSTLSKKIFLKAPSSLEYSVMQSIKAYHAAGPSFTKSSLFSVVLIILVLGTTIFYFATNFYPQIIGPLNTEISVRNFSFNVGPAFKLIDSAMLFKMVFYINGVICLFLFDHAVLKPFFAKRKQRFSM